jgi:hypothetical protein
LLIEAAKTAALEDGVAVKEQDESQPKVNTTADTKPNGNDGNSTKHEAEDDDANSANAVADASTSNKRPHEDAEKVPPLRRGKWTIEEEQYASRLIVEFKAGLLPLTDGTTLRTFLSKLLNCDPMRISKKFVGANCIGKQVFRRRSGDVSLLTPEQIQRTRRELSELEKRFLDRVANGPTTKGGGGGSKKRDKFERPEKKLKTSAPTSMVGGLAALAPNRSAAAAAGHALLGGQESQPGLFNTNSASSGGAGAVGFNIPAMGPSAGKSYVFVFFLYPMKSVSYLTMCISIESLKQQPRSTSIPLCFRPA